MFRNPDKTVSFNVTISPQPVPARQYLNTELPTSRAAAPSDDYGVDDCAHSVCPLHPQRYGSDCYTCRYTLQKLDTELTEYMNHR